MKGLRSLLLFAASVASIAQAQTNNQSTPSNQSNSAPRTGATGYFVDHNGNQVGPTVSLPDCRSCKVQQTGPNSYTVSVPQPVRNKVVPPK
jgi:hypothetical protein